MNGRIWRRHRTCRVCDAVAFVHSAQLGTELGTIQATILPPLAADRATERSSFDLARMFHCHGLHSEKSSSVYL